MTAHSAHLGSQGSISSVSSITSVPSRPSINGRRNRTQSEGEKNGIEASKLPENHQLE